MAQDTKITAAEPDRPIDWLLMPFHEFAKAEASGGIVLLACTTIALIWANSPWHASYHDLWHTKVTIGFGSYTISESLAHWVNDGLMAIFFFVVGLEIKREMLVGELASPRKAIVPISAAVGGMAIPALIYLAFNYGKPGQSGWAIPAATDIAFALGVMALLGSRVPTSLKVFLTALAIVDDIGAVLIIALFYTSDISLVALGAGGGILSLLLVANLMGVRKPMVYAFLGVFLWVAFLESGIHATVAGVLLAFTVPAKCRIKGSAFVAVAKKSLDEFERGGGNADEIVTNPARQSAVHLLEQACEHVQTPLRRMEHRLHPWVSFAIMPIFALANAGVTIGEGFFEGLMSGVGLGIVLGLVVGKQIAVTAFTWAVVKLGIGNLPMQTTWAQIYSVSWLAGIGFTMSLFVANLAFADQPELLGFAKIGILVGSLIAGVTGFLLLRITSPRHQES